MATSAAVRAELKNGPESRRSTQTEFELREVPNGTGGTNLRFTGFASVTGDEAAYEMEDYIGPWVESVNRGAFGKTLRESPDVAFLLNHQGMTLARTKPGTLKLAEVTDSGSSPIRGVTGLHSEALFDPTNMYVQAVRSAVDRGDLDEMSFGFRVMREKWNQEYDRRWIQEVNLDKGDVSLVNYGANPSTGGTVLLRQRPGLGRTVRAAGDDCNRCDGEGTISLQGNSVTCPQCLGSGTGENNTSADDDIVEQLDRHIRRTRLMLEQIRHPRPR